MTDKPSPKLLDRVCGKIRIKSYSIRTEQPHADWIKRFILFHGKRHPETMGLPIARLNPAYMARLAPIHVEL